MARILAIDYGTKRVGVAVTDPLQIIATGLTTVHSKDIVQFLQEYLAKEKVDCIVVGDPKQMDGSPSDAAKHIDRFVETLRKKVPSVPVERADERFTSRLAQRSMVESGMKKKDRQNKETVDMISATLILQYWLEKNKK